MLRGKYIFITHRQNYKLQKFLYEMTFVKVIGLNLSPYIPKYIFFAERGSNKFVQVRPSSNFFNGLLINMQLVLFDSVRFVLF